MLLHLIKSKTKKASQSNIQLAKVYRFFARKAEFKANQIERLQLEKGCNLSCYSLQSFTF